MKKIFSILLAVVMLMAMSTTAFAAGNDGSITIDNAVIDETYTIYQLLDLESYNSVSGAYAYKANPTWASWLKTQTTYLAFDGQGYVTWVDGADAATFAKLAKEYAATNSIANQGSATATDATVKFTNLDLGYYLVDTTLGTLCSLDTTDPSVTIQEKNEKPLIEKKVEEDDSNVYGDSNDANMTQTVNFKTTVTAKEGAEAYIVHDILSDGLTLDEDSVSVEGLTKGTHYTVEFSKSCTGKDKNPAVCDFHIIFAQSYLDTLKDDTQIIITYSATLNENAIVGLPGNPNDTRLQYSNDNWTEWDETITYTWDMGVLKYGNGNEANVLQGAKFVLLNKEKTQVATIVNGKFAGWANIPAEGTEWPAGAELTTGSDGKISVAGLDADTYYLRETQAPAGYNKLASDVEVKITGATNNDDDTLTYTTHVEKVNNQSGTVLPETGAEGTMMFITIGSLLAVVAVVFMVTRKKMSIYER